MTDPDLEAVFSKWWDKNVARWMAPNGLEQTEHDLSDLLERLDAHGFAIVRRFSATEQ